MNQQNEYKPSEGEIYLEDFFFMLDIKYESQKKIFGLRNDSKQFRIADFYLPKYQVYVEFFGLWNNSGNEEYSHKKDVYKQNKIPCVYIYPENLGIIEFTFDRRLQMVLEKHKLEKELRSYRLYKFKKAPELKNRIGYTGIAFFILLYTVFSKNLVLKEYLLIGATAFIILYQVFQLIQLYLDIFKRNKFSLGNLF